MKILVIQLRRIGDVLLTTPVVRALRKRYPQARIDFLVEKSSAQVLKNNPYLSNILVYSSSKPVGMILKIRASRYDMVLDFLNNPRSAILTALSGSPVTAGFKTKFWGSLYSRRILKSPHQVYVAEEKFRILKALNMSGDGIKMDFLPGPEEREFALKFIREKGIQESPWFAIIPTHRRDTRRWKSGHFARAMDNLYNQTKAALLLFWGPGEEETVQNVLKDVSCPVIPIPRCTFMQMAAILEYSKAVMTNDNGPMHAAVALGKPTLTFYGPTRPQNWNPLSPPHKYLQAQGLDCLGCGLNEIRRCPNKHACMTGICPDRAVEIFLEMI